MNKEEIERITLEVNVELGRPCVAHYLNTFATRFIERIDAERGNPPLGYDAIFKSIASATKAPGAPAGIEVSVRAFKEAIGGEIFLSPTIPEGMALVKTTTLDEVLESIDDGDTQSARRVLIEMMLADAQGERK